MLGVQGKVDAIPVEAEPGLTPEALRARINAVLPDQYEAVTADQVAAESAESWTKAVAFLPTALLLFAAVALLVGAFIICNTFSILVAQRARELALLRSLGASRAQLTASVLCEAVAVGVVGSLAGVLAGFGAARGLLALFDRMGFELPSAAAVFLPRTAAGRRPGRRGRHRPRRPAPRPPGHARWRRSARSGAPTAPAPAPPAAGGSSSAPASAPPAWPPCSPACSAAATGRVVAVGLGAVGHPRQPGRAAPLVARPAALGSRRPAGPLARASRRSSAGRTPCAAPAAPPPPPPP